MEGMPEGLRVDLGCGSNKREGTIGVDKQAFPGVDHVLDLEAQPLPFEDQSVAYVYSYHFLEHLDAPDRVFEEISRVCVHNARVELWTPYGWSNSAFVLGHKHVFTEEIYLHICVEYSDFWTKDLGARWVLNELQYVIAPETLCYLRKNGIGLDLAIGHLHNTVTEFCAYITVRQRDLSAPVPAYRRTFSVGRFAPRYEIMQVSASDMRQDEVERAIRSFAKGEPVPPPWTWTL